MQAVEIGVVVDLFDPKVRWERLITVPDEGSIPARSLHGATESVRSDIGRAHDELR